MRRSHDTIFDGLSPEKARVLSDVLRQGIDVKLHLLEHHTEMARLLACEIMEDEVITRAGEAYNREKPHGGRYRRWGSNPGSIRLGEERVPIAVPRVRDAVEEREQPLESYRRMKKGLEIDDRLEKAILRGLSQRDYEDVARRFADGFGLSQSSVSRKYQARSRKALEEFENRTLKEDFTGLWLDGKYLAGEQIVLCLGLTIDGRKLPLGFVETTTENSEAVKGLLQDLVRRGLDFSRGLFCVIDGSKGLSKAVREVFGIHGVIQRCQWHKRENVVSYLAKKDQSEYSRKLQAAYEKPTYDEAKAALMNVHAELERLNRSAARSLTEGLEETLTLHRLGLFHLLGKSLKTTNCIEAVNSRLTKYLGKVKHWMHSDQRHRWVAMGLLEIERKDRQKTTKKLRRIDNYEKLPLLRQAMLKYIEERQQTNGEAEPLAEEIFN
jgi:transposase-like protein